MEYSDTLNITVNGHFISVVPNMVMGFGLLVDAAFWGYFVDELVALNAAIVVINAPRFN